MSNLVEFKDLLGLSEPITKLVEIVSTAIGTVYEPRKIRKLADAESYRVERIINTISQIDFDGEAKYDGGNVILKKSTADSEEVKSLLVSELRKLYEETNNIKEIADYAYNELENTEVISSNNIDEDWKKYFFNFAKDVTTDEMKFLFGKILAGEIKQPGSFSKRIINNLVNLSQNEAQIFTHIANYIFEDGTHSFILGDSDLLSQFDIKFDDIICMEEAGLVNSNMLTVDGGSVFKCGNYVIDFCGAMPTLNAYILTTAGKQLLKIVNSELQIDYFKRIKENYNIDSMTYAKIISVKNINGLLSMRREEQINI